MHDLKYSKLENTPYSFSALLHIFEHSAVVTVNTAAILAAAELQPWTQHPAKPSMGTALIPENEPSSCANSYTSLLK